jgi:putative membrane protein
MKSLQRTHRLIYRTSAVVLLAAGTAFGADESETTRTTQGAGASQLQQHDANRAGEDKARLHDRTSQSHDSSAHSQHGQSSSMKVADAKSFIQEAMAGNAAEVALAEVAERRAQNVQVKQFASMLRQEHRQANEQLRSIAQAHGVSSTASLEPKHQQILNKLQQANGAEFDKAYMTEMLKDHHKDIRKYQQAAQQLKESDVKQYAQSTLPKLQKHLEHARQAALAVGIDQQTISSFTRDSSAATGGTQDRIEIDSGGDSSKENKD